MKKIFVIVIVILIVAVAGTLVYFTFFDKRLFVKDEGAAKVQEEVNPASGLPKSQEFKGETMNTIGGGTLYKGATSTYLDEENAAIKLEKFAKVLDDVYFPTMSADGKGIQYFDKSENNVYISNFIGLDKMAMTSEDFSYDLQNIVWSQDKNKAMFKFTDNIGDDLNYYYDIGEDKGLELSKYIKELIFTYNGQKIIYKYTNNDNKINSVAIGTPTAFLSDYKNLISTNVTNMMFKDAPKQNAFLYYLKPDDNRGSSVNALSYDGSLFQNVVTKGTGVDVLPSNSGGKIVYTKYSRGGLLNLWIADIDGANPNQLNLTAFIKGKTAWDANDEYIYLAVPKSAVKVSDYYNNGVKTSDEIWRINAKTLKSEKLYDPADDKKVISVDAIFVTPKSRLLYLRDANSDALFELNLDKVLSGE